MLFSLFQFAEKEVALCAFRKERSKFGNLSLFPFAPRGKLLFRFPVRICGRGDFFQEGWCKADILRLCK